MCPGCSAPVTVISMALSRAAGGRGAWEAWRAEVDFAARFVAGAPSLDITGEGSAESAWHGGGPMSLREVLVGMIEEYSRHMGHADLLRERMTGASASDDHGQRHCPQAH